MIKKADSSNSNNFKNTLYYGDNLDILKVLSSDKEFFLKTNGGIDLIYIDPPFNSNRNYNILYEDLLKSKENGEKNKAQKEAFGDTWSNLEYTRELEELKELIECPQLYNFLESNKKIFTFEQMSYLVMMAHRLYYIHKILKDT
jgi:16S rRNA G966 N2-methylase RsmD